MQLDDTGFIGRRKPEKKARRQDQAMCWKRTIVPTMDGLA